MPGSGCEEHLGLPWESNIRRDQQPWCYVSVNSANWEHFVLFCFLSRVCSRMVSLKSETHPGFLCGKRPRSDYATADTTLTGEPGPPMDKR